MPCIKKDIIISFIKKGFPTDAESLFTFIKR